MTDRDIGREVLDGIREIKKFKDMGSPELRTRALEGPSAASEIRMRLKLSQEAFAALMGVSVRTVQDWEQGRRVPQGPAKSLLRVAEQYPEVFVALR